MRRSAASGSPAARSTPAARADAAPCASRSRRTSCSTKAPATPAAFDRAVEAGRVVHQAPPGSFQVTDRHPSLENARVAVVGAGPAGLFAALVLARNGVAVDVLDRGASLARRGRDVAAFVRTREPNPESNLLFGEGGAGTYSDGKLYTRVDHPLEQPILDELIAAGAPPEIAVDARAHIGTDRLHRILPRLRDSLEAQGVTFHWDTRVEGWEAQNATDSRHRIRALKGPFGELATDAVVLAPGHSARDTLRALAHQGLPVEAKPFQFGVRVEHPQDLITRARHGTSPEAALLGPAYYGLTCKAGEGAAAAHSFCMCPGGQIVASVSAPGFLCTNGMSNSRHSSPWANAALVVTLGARELAAYGDDAFAGVRFQEAVEAAFFEAGGGDYHAPTQRVPDFLAGRGSTGALETSFKLGAVPGRIDTLLPEAIRDALRRALGRWGRSIDGFAGPEGLLVGVESRSSGPIRVPRDDALRCAAGFENLYPVGEGAGHAGGIMSAAIDGARSAQALLRAGVARAVARP